MLGRERRAQPRCCEIFDGIHVQTFLGTRRFIQLFETWIACLLLASACFRFSYHRPSREHGFILTRYSIRSDMKSLLQGCQWNEP